MRTEVSAEQWLEFANAFGHLGDPYRIGRGVREIEPVIGTPPGTYVFQYAPGPDMEIAPVSNVTWRNAARYCNWLHNGKEASLEALESGAYDTSTFGEEECFPGGPDSCLTDARGHMPGARYWIPTLDQWLKAVHYDPEHGWRLYPHGGDEPLTPGPATDPNAETNTAYDDINDLFSYRIGRYPDVQTPWGLLDASGGVSEWIEDVRVNLVIRTRYVAGSYRRQSLGLTNDRADRIMDAFPELPGVATGLRLASVPAAGPSADMNGDGMINFWDLNAVLNGWGTALGDIDGDGETGFGDLSLMLEQWDCN